MTTTHTTEGADLYRARQGKIDFINVPALKVIFIDGQGRPDEPEGSFQDAIGSLFGVAYAAHFIVKKQSGEAPRVMPLEALWWVTGPDPSNFEGAATDAWRWRAFIVQPPPIDTATVALAMKQASPKHPNLDTALHFESWHEGKCAQTLHVGPYDAESPTIAALHEAIRQAGYRPRGRHHEIYLGDPRRSAPERLKTLIRQPIEPVGVHHA